jgi:hypothetical protein
MILNRHCAGPSDHVIEYVRGRVVREGRGLNFLYMPQITKIVSVPLSSNDARFEFRERSSDFQRVRVEGEVVYKVTNPRRAASMLDFTVRRSAEDMRSEAAALLRRRVLAVAQDIVRDELSSMPIRQALLSGTTLGRSARIRMSHSRQLRDMGVTVISVFVKEVRGPSEVAKAMEAGNMEKAVVGGDQTACDSLLVARGPGPERHGPARVVEGPPPSIECNASCPFRHMCEDFMSDVRDGRAWCTLFKEFSM